MCSCMQKLFRPLAAILNKFKYMDKSFNATWQQAKVLIAIAIKTSSSWAALSEQPCKFMWIQWWQSGRSRTVYLYIYILSVLSQVRAYCEPLIVGIALVDRGP